MKNIFFFGVLCVLCSVCLSEDQDGYIFTCPRTLKKGANNQLNFRRFGSMDEGTLKVQVFYKKNYDSKNETVAASKEFKIAKGEPETVLKLFVDTLDDNPYSGRIQINGTFNGKKISGTNDVNFASPKKSILIIQTDKPIYKPGETVKFRILKVNKKLKPYQSKNKTIAYVEDPKGTRLFQFEDLDLTKGLIQKQFKLSDDPVKGSWTIRVKVGDDQESTSIDVKDYVLPKFDVKIKFPPFVLANAESFPIKVCAEYTFGEPVSGTLHLNASLETYDYERRYNHVKLPTKTINTHIDGCYTFNLKVSEIQSNESYYNSRSIEVKASVTEDGTGVEKSASNELNRDSQPLELSFIDSLDHYKPGLPYNGKLKVSNPDNTVASGESIEICVTIDKKRILADWWATKTLKICRNYTSSSEGLIKYTILPQNVDVISMSLEAKALKYDPDTNKDVGYGANQVRQPTANKYLDPYFSPSGSFLQIQPIHQPIACGSKQTLKVLFTSKDGGQYKFYYQVSYQSAVVVDSSVQTTFSKDNDVSDKYEKKSRVINGSEKQLEPPKDSIPQSSIDDCPEAKDSKYLPPLGEVSIDINVNTTMSPSIHVLAYYVKDSGEVVADSMQIDVENCFENKVKFAFGDKTKQPGTKTSVSVTAGSNSYCGIKAIDKSVLLLDSSDQLTKEKVFQMKAQFDQNNYYSSNPCYSNPIQPGLQNAEVKSLEIPFPPGGNTNSYEDSLSAFQTSGFLVISNLYIFTRPCQNRARSSYREGEAAEVAGPDGKPIQLVAPSGSSGFSLQSASEVRSNFPETWLFELDMTGDDGTFQKTVTLPDTITEYIGSAVCINTADGLGLSNTTSITGFQAFFIDYTLPVSVIRGEEFTVVVSIFSYADAALPITVNLKNPQGFKVTSSINGDVCIQPNSSVTLPLSLKATKVGHVQLTVSAETSNSSSACGSSPTSDSYARDAIRKPIEVKPEGFPDEKVINTLFCPSEDGKDNSFSTSVTLELPKDVVPDSQRAYVDITGNVMGPAINNLNNLVQLPTGCGEQNMVKFTPNYLVLDYLKDIGQLTSEIKNKAINNLISGYQRELNYRHYDGSFSAFGQTDNEGSMFLTAFVLSSFYEAQRYIYIDDGLIKDMQDWIISKQSTNGCFPNIGKIIDIDLQGGISDDNASGSITAYVIASLIISKYDNKTIINDAFSCLDEISATNPYSQFLYAYAYALNGDNQKAQDLIDKARQKVDREDGKESFIIVNGTKAIEIETDAYAVLTTLKIGGSKSDALPYVRYLTSNLNPNGGFTSTQDTCVGLSALAHYASEVYKDKLKLMVQTTGGLKKSVTIDDDNKLLVQRFKVKDISKSINIKAQGTGCGLIQTTALFNTKTAPEKKKFSIKVQGDCSDSKCNSAKITSLVSYLPAGQKAGMSIVQIKLITGFSPVRQTLDDLKNNDNNNILRIDVEDNTVIIYFSEISNAVDKITFDVNQVVKVKNAQPGTAKVYDYYAPEKSAATSYKIDSSK